MLLELNRAARVVVAIGALGLVVCVVLLPWSISPWSALDPVTYKPAWEGYVRGDTGHFAYTLDFAVSRFLVQLGAIALFEVLGLYVVGAFRAKPMSPV